MAVLIDAINVKKRTLFELDNTPFSCLEAEVNTPTARGGQTLVRLKIRNKASAEYFIKWIDQLHDLAEEWPFWRSQAEKDHVYAQFRQARAVYTDLLK